VEKNVDTKSIFGLARSRRGGVSSVVNASAENRQADRTSDRRVFMLFLLFSIVIR